ncbi:uncharacterized protein LOC131532155 isoform X2 [Onychostoma macrolepis]|uniref:uncharacterized protein LOC131532155 isoform X2 n=1 Tax=Onychostoma macrolepis TaxID=369639 RepID=UPI00272C5CD4|nr:uncharacterized protein LOC131532155 isoform X2 [Onychostoma macrolepis]
MVSLRKSFSRREASLMERDKKLSREEMEKDPVGVTDGTDSAWSIRDQLSERRSRNTQDSEISLSLLCYTDTQESVCDSHASTDQISTESLGSDCNAEEEQTPLKMCSVKLEDCRNLTEMKRETTADEELSDDDDDDVFIPSAKSICWTLQYKEYMNYLVDQGTPNQTKQILAPQFNLSLRTPDLIITLRLTSLKGAA